MQILQINFKDSTSTTQPPMTSTQTTDKVEPELTSPIGTSKAGADTFNSIFRCDFINATNLSACGGDIINQAPKQIAGVFQKVKTSGFELTSPETGKF